MSIAKLLSLIDAEIATLRQVRSLVAGTTAATEKRKPGRPKSTDAPAVQPAQKRRNMSPEGRARIAAAVKARWARQKKAAGK